MKRSSSSLEYPTSPPQQPADNGEEDKEFTHYSHSKHPLIPIALPELFTCSGCREFGVGKRFSCQQCEYQLHDFCARSTAVLNNHPLHGQHQLIFHSKPKQAKGGITRPRCDVCGKSTKGFTFRCRACSFQMHPCCAMLSTEINFPTHRHALRLLPCSTGDSLPTACDESKKRRSSGRVYQCTVCDYNLHAVCAKSLINGLKDYGISPPEKPSVIGAAARLASQIVVEFIGGLIEGIGEGMGEVLVQNIARGRRTSSSSYSARTRRFNQE